MIPYINTIKKNISHIPGWRTRRKIVVIESDDWGSTRIKDKNAYQALKKKGLNVDAIHYDSVESLESNIDLSNLFELLLSIRDSKGNNPVFTSFCIMGNPDFEKIKWSNYREYSFQPLEETLHEFPLSDRIIEIWKKGYDENIFRPELHGREHINIRRYMRILQNHEGKEGLRYALDFHSLGPSRFKNYAYPNYLGALHPEETSEIQDYHQYLLDAATLFERYLGYQPHLFVAPNAEEPKELESTLWKIGVKYLSRSRIRIHPLGDGKFVKEWNFTGQKTLHDQIIINRNAFFEPVSWGGERKVNDWVDSCLHDISLAFRWHKPAVISSHRVNYVGSISSNNRDKGLAALKRLLSTIIKKWPDVEFMSSKTLGETICQKYVH
jgi:hypothetical protein